MLERGVACVEPSVQHLIRQIERPVKSKKRLRQAFWYYHNHPSPVPSWWPHFLEATRATAKHNGTAFSGQDAPYLDFLYPQSVGWASSTQSGSKTSERCLLQSRVPRVKTNGHGQSYTTTARRSQRTEIEQASKVDNGDVITSVKDYWHQRAQMDFDTDGDQPAPPAQVDDRGATSVSSQQSHTLRGTFQDDAFTGKNLREKEQSIQAHRQAIETYNQTSEAEKVMEQRLSAAIAAVELNDLALAKAIVEDAVASRHYIRLVSIVIEKLVEYDRFGEAADIFEIANKREITGLEHFKHPVAVHLPDKALKVLEILKGTNPQREEARHKSLENLAFVLFKQMAKNQIVMRNLTPDGLITLTTAYDDARILTPSLLMSALSTLNVMARRRSRPDMAILVYRVLRQRFPETKIPSHVYGSLISILNEAINSDSYSKGAKAFRFILSEFASVYGKADHAAYQRVLTACARQGDVEAVHEFYQEYCKVHGKTDNPAVLNSLIYVHARLGNVAETQKQFDWVVNELGHTPGVIVWNTLLAAYARCQDLPGAIQVFRRMRAAGVAPDEFSFGTMMSICSRLGDAESVLYVASEAETHGVQLTLPMMDCLVRAYCANDDLTKAEEVAEAAVKMQLDQYPIRPWNSILTYLAHRADTRNILRIQQRLKELHIMPDGMTYAALMLSLTKIGRTKDARNILRALHLSGHATMSITHYAIVMHGFAREGCRDEVTALYFELLERSRKPNFSANLAMLSSQADRDSDSFAADISALVTQAVPVKGGENQLLRARAGHNKELPHASKFLDHILANLDVKELASKSPNPFVGKFKVVDVVPGEFFKVMIRILGRQGAFHRVRSLMYQYRRARTELGFGGEDKNELPLQLLDASMKTYREQKDHKKVEELWQKRLLEAIEAGRPKKILAQGLKHNEQPDESKQTSITQTTTEKAVEPLKQSNLQILRSHRFAVSSVLNHFMISLGAQKLHARLPPLVESLQNVGFDLNSKNWNKYVQLLASSDQPELQLTAFTTFQEKLLKNMPPWALLARGKAIQPEPGKTQAELHSEQKGEVISISLLERINRSDPFPRYYTVVFLGMALMRFRERSRLDHGAELHRLLRSAKETVVAVTKMPYLRDRVQGVLLRGRVPKGDPAKRRLNSTKGNATGLLGSRSAVDGVPPENQVDVVEMQSLLDEDEDENDMSVDEETEPDLLQLENQLFGNERDQRFKMVHSLSEGSDLEQNQTAERTKMQRLARMRRLIREANRHHLMADQVRGEPAFDALQSLVVETVGSSDSQAPSVNEAKDVRQKEETTGSYVTSDNQQITFYDPNPEIESSSYQPRVRKLPTRGFDSYGSTTHDNLWKKIYSSGTKGKKRRAFTRNKRLALQRSLRRRIVSSRPASAK